VNDLGYVKCVKFNTNFSNCAQLFVCTFQILCAHFKENSIARNWKYKWCF